jgi:hypothetical protein
MKKNFLFILTLLLAHQLLISQVRTITTAVPFVLIAADARAAGMADQGVGTAPDAFSQQWNPSKYAFAEDEWAFSLGYTPYLQSITNDISLSQATFYHRFREQSAFGGSLRYFSLGEIELRTYYDDPARVVKPNELSLDLSYSLKLSERFAMSVAGRYIRSNLKIADATTDASAANGFCVDVSGFYQSETAAYSSFDGRYRWGFNFQNLGPKISYDNQDINANFLPSNLRVGGGFDFIFDEYNKLAVNVEFTKLLVPTPPSKDDINNDGVIDNSELAVYNKKVNDYKSTGWVDGIFKSFNDAPDGISEELKEITYSVGTEYLYQNSFALRAGYFHESEMKGARRFYSIGAGFKFSTIKFDMSYLFSASAIRSPLENTLRFSLSFSFGDKYDDL